MKKYNLSVPQKYISNGVEKTFWSNVGTMTEFPKQDGTTSRIVEIPAIGLKASVFPIVPREQYQKPVEKQGPVPMTEGVEYPEDINPDDIPF